MNGPSTTITDPESGETKTFTFDYSYNSFLPADHPEAANQETLFQDLGNFYLENAFGGFNSCLFAYGQTGSGKSYSMTGGSGDARGIIPRGCEELFNRVAQNADPNISYVVEISYLEIYNEQIKDLLAPRSTKTLRIRENPKTGVYVQNLSRSLVRDYEEISHMYEEGIQARTVAQTKMNNTSSRSHSVLAIYFKRIERHPDGRKPSTTESQTNLVDLAGSERQKDTGAEGARLAEACAINKSLSALGNVISALAHNCAVPANKQRFVPFRNSVLTRVLQDSLGGNSKTVMIAALSPASVNYEETLSTLRFADRVKSIKTKAVKNENASDRLIRELRAQIEQLQGQLSGKAPLSAPGRGPVPDSAAMRELEAELELRNERLRTLEMSYDERVQQTEQMKQERQRALEDMGISVQEMTSMLGVGDQPYLSNLSPDRSLTDSLAYFIAPGETTLGSDLDKNKIVLKGLGVLPSHAALAHTDGRVTVTPQPDAAVFINGHRAPAGESSPLTNGDRVIVGRHLVFRFVVPSAEPAELLDPEEEWELVTKELAVAHGRVASVEEYDQQSQQRASVLSAMSLVEEANEISRTLKRGVSFALLTETGAADGSDDGASRVFVSVTSLRRGVQNRWAVAELEQRIEVMREMLADFLEDGVLDCEPEQDPFYDPPADEHIATATLDLSALLMQTTLTADLQLVSPQTGRAVGTLRASCSLLDEAGCILPADALGALTERNLAARIRLRDVRVRTSADRRGFFCLYPFGGADQVTQRVVSLTGEGDNADAHHMDLGHVQTFRYAPFTDAIAEELRQPFEVKLFAHAGTDDPLEALSKARLEIKHLRRENQMLRVRIQLRQGARARLAGAVQASASASASTSEHAPEAVSSTEIPTPPTAPTAPQPVEAQIDTAVDRIAHLQEMNARLRAEVDKMERKQADYSAKDDRIDQLLKQNLLLMRRLQQNHISVAEAPAAGDASSGDTNGNDEALEPFMKELLALRRENAALRAGRGTSTETRTVTTATTLASQAQRDEVAETATISAAELAELRERNAALAREAESAQQERDSMQQLRERNAALAREAESAQQERDSMQQLVDRMKGALESCRPMSVKLDDLDAARRPGSSVGNTSTSAEVSEELIAQRVAEACREYTEELARLESVVATLRTSLLARPARTHDDSGSEHSGSEGERESESEDEFRMGVHRTRRTTRTTTTTSGPDNTALLAQLDALTGRLGKLRTQAGRGKASSTTTTTTTVTVTKAGSDVPAPEPQCNHAAEIEALIRERDFLRSELQDKTALVGELTDQLSALQSLTSALRTQVGRTQTTTTITEEAPDTSSLLSQLDSLSTRLAGLHTRASQLRRDGSTTTTTTTVFTHTGAAGGGGSPQDERVGRLETKIARLTEELRTKGRDLGAAETRLEELCMELRRTTSGLHEAQGDADALRHQLEAARATAQEHHKGMIEAQHALHQLRQTTAVLKYSEAELQARIAASRQEDLEENQLIRAQIEELEAIIETLRTQLLEQQGARTRTTVTTTDLHSGSGVPAMQSLCSRVVSSQQIARLRKQLEDSEGARSLLETTAQELRVRVETTEKDLESARAEAEAAHERAHETQQRYDSLVSRTALLKYSEAELQSLVERTRHEGREEADQIRKQLAQLSTVLARLREKIAQQSVQITQQTRATRTEKIATQLGSIGAQLTHQRDIQSLQEKLEALRTQINTLQAENEQLRNDVAARSAEVADLKHRNERGRAALQQRGREKKNLEQTVAETRREVTTITQQKCALLEDKRRLQQRLQKIQAQLKELTTSSATHTEVLEREVASLRREAEQLRTSVQALEQERAKLTERVGESESLVVVLRQETERLTTTMDKERGESSARIAELLQLIEHLRTLLARLPSFGTQTHTQTTIVERETGGLSDLIGGLVARLHRGAKNSATTRTTTTTKTTKEMRIDHATDDDLAALFALLRSVQAGIEKLTALLMEAPTRKPACEREASSDESSGDDRTPRQPMRMRIVQTPLAGSHSAEVSRLLRLLDQVWAQLVKLQRARRIALGQGGIEGTHTHTDTHTSTHTTLTATSAAASNTVASDASPQMHVQMRLEQSLLEISQLRDEKDHLRSQLQQAMRLLERHQRQMQMEVQAVGSVYSSLATAQGDADETPVPHSTMRLVTATATGTASSEPEPLLPAVPAHPRLDPREYPAIPEDVLERVGDRVVALYEQKRRKRDSKVCAIM